MNLVLGERLYEKTATGKYPNVVDTPVSSSTPKEIEFTIDDLEPRNGDLYIEPCQEIEHHIT